MNKKTKIIILAASAAVFAGLYYKQKIPLANGTEISTTKKTISGALLGASFSALVIVLIDLIKK
jgi:hypothetical protein